MVTAVLMGVLALVTASSTGLFLKADQAFHDSADKSDIQQLFSQITLSQDGCNKSWGGTQVDPNNFTTEQALATPPQIWTSSSDTQQFMKEGQKLGNYEVSHLGLQFLGKLENGDIDIFVAEIHVGLESSDAKTYTFNQPVMVNVGMRPNADPNATPVYEIKNCESATRAPASGIGTTTDYELNCVDVALNSYNTDFNAPAVRLLGTTHPERVVYKNVDGSGHTQEIRVPSENDANQNLNDIFEFFPSSPHPANLDVKDGVWGTRCRAEFGWQLSGCTIGSGFHWGRELDAENNVNNYDSDLYQFGNGCWSGTEEFKVKNDRFNVFRGSIIDTSCCKMVPKSPSQSGGSP